MKLIFAAAMLVSGIPSAALAASGSVDAVIENLDLTSFPNSMGAKRDLKRKSFSDWGFRVESKDARGARLINKTNGREKSFTIIRDGPKYIRLCFHDKFSVMPNSSDPIHYDRTLALEVIKSDDQMWIAKIVGGGFLHCHNDPAL